MKKHTIVYTMISDLEHVIETLKTNIDRVESLGLPSGQRINVVSYLSTALDQIQGAKIALRRIYTIWETLEEEFEGGEEGSDC